MVTKELQRHHFGRRVENRAEELFNRTEPPPTAKEIAADLVAEFGVDGVDTPSERTIRGWIRDGVIRKVDHQRRWTVFDGEADDARLVAELLQALAEPNGDWINTITVRDAERIARLRRVFPSYDPHDIWDAAMKVDDGLDTHYGSKPSVTEYLMYRTWTSEGYDRWRWRAHLPTERSAAAAPATEDQP